MGIVPIGSRLSTLKLRRLLKQQLGCAKGAFGSPRIGYPGHKCWPSLPDFFLIWVLPPSHAIGFLADPTQRQLSPRLGEAVRLCLLRTLAS